MRNVTFHRRPQWDLRRCLDSNKWTCQRCESTGGWSGLAQALVQTDMRVAWVLLSGPGEGATADAELCALFNPPRFSGLHYRYHQVEHSRILHSANTVHLCVLCGSRTKQRLFPYTASNDWFLHTIQRVYCAVRSEPFKQHSDSISPLNNLCYKRCSTRTITLQNNTSG
jgi:hypothetical protein